MIAIVTARVDIPRESTPYPRYWLVIAEQDFTSTNNGVDYFRAMEDNLRVNKD